MKTTKKKRSLLRINWELDDNKRNSISSCLFFSIQYPNNSTMDKSNPLFTLAQDALEKERKEQQHDVAQKVSSSLSCSWACVVSSLSLRNLCVCLMKKSAWSYLYIFVCGKSSWNRHGHIYVHQDQVYYPNTMVIRRIILRWVELLHIRVIFGS